MHKHTVEMLEESLKLASTCGIRVSQEWLYGSGGPCVIKGKPCLYLDLSLSHVEQLDQVVAAIQQTGVPAEATVSRALSRMIDGGEKRAAA